MHESHFVVFGSGICKFKKTIQSKSNSRTYQNGTWHHAKNKARYICSNDNTTTWKQKLKNAYWMLQKWQIGVTLNLFMRSMLIHISPNQAQNLPFKAIPWHVKLDPSSRRSKFCTWPPGTKYRKVHMRQLFWFNFPATSIKQVEKGCPEAAILGSPRELR